MKRIATILSILLLILIANAMVFAQPGAISTNNLVGASTYNCTVLTDVGAFRQARIQAGTSSSSVTWEFPADCGFPGDVWRPYTAGSAAIAFNTYIAPNGGSNIGALYNGTNGGSAGTLAATTSGLYYTFNVQKVSAPTNASMEILETSFNPVTISSATFTAPSNASNGTLVTVTTSSTPSSGENVFVRYTTDAWTTSTLVQCTFTGTTGLAMLPCFSGGTSVSFYVYSSPKSLASINSDVTTDGQPAHDMATLNLNNNSGSNFTYTQGSGTNFSGTYNIPSTCYATLSAFVTALNGGTIDGAVTCYVNAGYTETISARINMTATGTVTNTITFQKFGTGTNPKITAFTGTATPGSAAPDGIWSLQGSDYVTIDGIDLFDGASTNPASMEYGYGLFKNSATDGAQNNTIKNCTITLTRANNASGTSPMIEGSVGILVINSLPTTATTAVTPTAASGANNSNKFYTNTIQNCNYGIALSGYAAATPFTLGDTGNDIGGSSASTGNSILNYGGATSATNPAAGIRANNQWSVNISYNTVNNNNGSGVSHVSTLRGIYAQAGTSANATINYNTVTLQSGAITSACTAIENGIGSTAASNTVTINYNRINGAYTTATTGVFTGISNSASAATVNINNNYLTGVASTNLAGTGTHVMIETGSPTTVTTNNDTIISVNRGGASGSWRGIKTTSPTNWTCNSNLIDGLSWTAAASTGSIDAIYSFSSAVNVTSSNNIIRNLSTPTTGTITGINEFGVAGIKTFQNNLIYNFSTTSGGAGGATFTGISCSTGTVEVSNNQIYSLNSTGTTGGSGGVLSGIKLGSSTANRAFKNKIYDLSTTSTTSTSGAVVGILVSSGTTDSVYNNLIGDLRATASAATDAIRGISMTSSTTTSAINVFYNTVYLNATSSGANFGTSGIFHTTNATATTAALNMRNNVVTNLSTPNGTGYTVAYRRSSTTLTNYASTSNNNDLYVNPGAGVRRYYFSHGATNADNDSTFAAYKTRMATRDQNSFAEGPTFVSTTGSDLTFLHINTTTPTQIESGAAPIATVTTDYDGDTRNGTNPDIGADEFAGVALDLTAPAISYTTLGNSSGLTTRSFSAVTITDPSGVNTTAGTKPRVYYKKSTQANTVNDNTNATDGWKYVESNGTTSPFDFTIDYSLVFGGSVVANDTIQYFVVAQDNAGTPNVGINSGTFAVTPSSVALTSAAFPLTGTINRYNVVGTISGTKTVGASGADYATITAAVAALNNAELTGPLTFSLIDASYSASETFPIVINANSGSSATNTVTFKPTGTTTISGTSATSIFKVNGADYIIFDGSNTALSPQGTDKSLTITNASTSGTVAAIWVASLGTGAGATNVTIKNCIINNGFNTSGSYGVFVGGTSIGTAGDDNDKCTIQNNAITKVYYGIYAAANATGLDDSLSVTQNSLGTLTVGSEIQFTGIFLAQCNVATVNSNSISNILSSGSLDQIGINLSTGCLNTTVNANTISGVYSTSTGGYGGRGIQINTGSASSNLVISNNMISDIKGSGWNSFTSDAIMGIALGNLSATGGVKLYYNDVNLGSGSFSGSTSGTLSAALYIGTSSTTIDVRNNILATNLVNSAASGAKTYALYSASANTAYSDINYNDYYASGTQGVLGYLGADQATITAWRTATGKDVNSLSGDPNFTSTTNLHINTLIAGSPVSNTGNNIATVPTDYDGDARNGSTPDIGADEFAYPTPTAFTLTSPSGIGQGVSGTLSWTASTNANHYNVYLDQSNPPTTLFAGNVAGTSTGYSNFFPNTTYYWEAYAVGVDSANGGNIKSTNGPLTFTTVTPPADPSGLMLSNVLQDSIYLSWTDNAADGPNSDTGFVVYRKAGSAPSVGGGSPDSVASVAAFAGTGTVTYQDHNLLPNTRYYYRVSARNANGESNYTSADTTSMAKTPGAPALTPSGHFIRVAITPLTNPASTEFALRFNDTAYVNTSGALSATPVWATYAAFGGATGVSVTGLTSGTLYMFDAKARNAHGYETGFSDHASTTTLGGMSGDYTVGLTLFNSVTGHDVSFKKEIRKITVTSEELIETSQDKSKSSEPQYRTVTKEVDQEYYVPIENGKPFDGHLYAVLPNSPLTGGVYATITAAVADLNDRGVIGAVRLLLDDASYPSETFPIAVNEISGASATNTITVLPNTGVSSSVSGSSASAIFKLNGTDYFTFDGSNNGSSSRNLTISNTSTSSSTAAIWLASLGTGAGATNNTIKNCIVSGGANTSGVYGIIVGGTTIGSTGSDNDNVTIQNNDVSKAYVGIWAQATSAGVNDNLSITQNSIGSSSSGSYIGHDGIYVVQGTGGTISQNTVYNIITGNTTPVGITVSTGFVSATISRNNINNVAYTGTGGYGGRGFYVNTRTSSSNLTFSNNLIYVIGGDGYSSFSNSSPVGMFFDSTNGGLNIYYNSVYMSGNLTYGTTTATVTTAILFNSSANTGIDLRNNVFENTMSHVTTTTSKNYAIYSLAPAGSFTQINHNDYYTSGSQGVLGYLGADKTTLSAWQTATGQDGQSISGDPLFTSTTNLHINNAPGMFSPTANAGVTIAGVTTDYDGDTRSSTPDIGADEFVLAAPGSFTLLSPTGVSQPIASILLWNKSVGASRYDVYVGTDNPPTTLVANNVTDTAYTFSGNPSTTYYWNVYAETGDSAAGSRTISSNGPLSYTTVDAPNSPTNLTLTTGFDGPGEALKNKIAQLELSKSSATRKELRTIETELEVLKQQLLASVPWIELNWVDNASNEDSFYVYRKVGSAPSIGAPYTDLFAVVAPSTGSGAHVIFTNISLDLDKHYYYRVTAFGNAVESGFTGADTTTLAETPGAPVFNAVSYNTMKIFVDPATNPSNTQFAIKDSSSGQYVKADGTIGSVTEVWQTYAGWGGASGFALTGLSRGTVYSFSIKAENGAGVNTAFGPSGSAQTTFEQLGIVLSEGFEGATFPPTGWQAVQNDGGAVNWIRSTGYQRTGTNAADAGYESSILTNDDWLITPLVHVPTNAAFLNFYYRARSTAFLDTFEVWLTTTGSTPADFINNGVKLYNNSNNNFTTYQYKSIDLATYAGQNVYIAWRYDALDAWHLFIDDINMTGVVPPNTITVRKYRDADGSFGTTGDRTEKAWRLELHADSLHGTLMGSVDSDTVLTVPNLLDGTYYAVEADSAGWSHLGYVVDASATASTNNSVSVSVTGGSQSRAVSFINVHPNTVVVNKFYDVDGDFGTTGDRNAKAWELTVYNGSVAPGNIVGSSATGSLTVSTLGDGTYIVAEADSSGWGSIGKIVNGTPMAGTAVYDTFTVANGQTHTVDFVNQKFSGIIVNKYRDINGGTVTFDQAKSWYLAVHSDSCNGSLIASGNAATVNAFNIPPGTYYITEADSAGWTHAGYRVNGGSIVEGTSSCVTVVVGSGEQHVVDLANFHPNMITVNKLRDADGFLQTTGDQTAKAWSLELHADSLHGALVGSVSSSSTLAVNDLGDGTYYAVEADSAGWVHLGNSMNGADPSNAIALTVSNGQSLSLTFINLKGNTITLRKFVDPDGDFATTTGRTAKAWGMELYRGDVQLGNLVTLGNATTVTGSNLGDGMYIAAEADSAGWLHIGRISNSSAIAGSLRFDTIVVADGQTYITDFVNSRTNGLTVSKYRDTDGGSPTKDVAKSWFLAIHSGSCSGPVVASGNSTSVTASGLAAGTYYVSEADSSGWTHLGYGVDGGTPSASSSSCVTVTVGAGEAKSVEFVNFHPNTITVRKYRDADGGSASFDASMKWGLQLKNESSIVVGQIEDSVLTVSGLGDGTYKAFEADSAFWSATGYRLDGNVTSGSVSSGVDITVADGQSSMLDFANSIADTMKFYSVRADSFALDTDSKGAQKSIPKKADKVRFTFSVTADSDNVNDLHLEFAVDIDTVNYPFTMTPTPASLTAVPKSLKKWNATFSPSINAGTIITVSGYGKKGSIQKVSSYNWTRNGTLVGKKKKSPTFTDNTLRLPMPNLHNLGEEIFAQGAFTSTTGMVVGVAHPDAPNAYAWVLHKKYSEVQKSLVKKVKTVYLMHDSTARCFDQFKNGKFLVKKQTSLPPDKYDNKLFADLIALKLNIAASQLTKTPVGFGELKVVADGTPTPILFDGLMVKEIAALADTVLTNCSTSRDPLSPVDLDNLIASINNAFSAPLDTLSWSSKLVVKPSIRISAVDFLVRDPSIVPSTIVPLENEIAQLPEKYELYQNYPNPFNPTTRISFDLPMTSKITLKIFNVLGQEVMTLIDGVTMEDGTQEVEFNAQRLASGVYFYQLNATSVDEGSDATFTETKKLMLIK